MDYEQDMLIDHDALDVEWLNQPQLAFKYGKNLARLEYLVNQKSEELSILEADLRDKANQNPDEYLGEGVKATNDNIKAYVIRNEEYKECKESLRKLEYDHAIANIARIEVSNTRKAALENLVKLHGMNYFAGPSMPRDLSFEAQKREQQKQVDKKIGSKMIRNKNV
jgi:hypothetical protein